MALNWNFIIIIIVAEKWNHLNLVVLIYCHRFISVAEEEEVELNFGSAFRFSYRST